MTKKDEATIVFGGAALMLLGILCFTYVDNARTEALMNDAYVACLSAGGSHTTCYHLKPSY